MKISLQTWNAILLGPVALSMTYLSQTPAKPDPATRALVIGILLYLAIPVLVLLVVDSIKIYQYYKNKKENNL